MCVFFALFFGMDEILRIFEVETWPTVFCRFQQYESITLVSCWGSRLWRMSRCATSRCRHGALAVCCCRAVYCLNPRQKCPKHVQFFESKLPKISLGIFKDVVTQKVFFFLTLPSLKLTYPLKIDPWKRRYLLETIISRGYVSFRECTFWCPFVLFYSRHITSVFETVLNTRKPVPGSKFAILPAVMRSKQNMLQALQSMTGVMIFYQPIATIHFWFFWGKKSPSTLLVQHLHQGWIQSTSGLSVADRQGPVADDHQLGSQKLLGKHQDRHQRRFLNVIIIIIIIINVYHCFSSFPEHSDKHTFTTNHS